MRLRQELTYDATPDEVLAMLHDGAFWDQVAEATGALSSTATVERAEDRVTVVVDQEQPVAGVPAFARSFVGDSTRAVKTTAWDGDTATLEIATPGKPTHISGQCTVEPRDAGSAVVYDIDVRAKVPLVGGKLEKLVVELTGAGFEKEQAVGAAWLAGDR